MNLLDEYAFLDSEGNEVSVRPGALVEVTVDHVDVQDGWTGVSDLIPTAKRITIDGEPFHGTMELRVSPSKVKQGLQDLINEIDEDLGF